MLYADKRALETNLKVSLLQIRERELNFYTQNCLAVGTQSALLAGFAFAGLTQVSVPHDAHYAVKLLYLLFTTGAMSCELIAVLNTTLLSMLGPGLALRGPDGSMHKAVDGMMYEYRKAFFTFGLGLIAFHFSALLFGWLMFRTRARARVGRAARRQRARGRPSDLTRPARVRARARSRSAACATRPQRSPSASRCVLLPRCTCCTATSCASSPSSSSRRTWSSPAASRRTRSSRRRARPVWMRRSSRRSDGVRTPRGARSAAPRLAPAARECAHTLEPASARLAARAQADLEGAAWLRPGGGRRRGRRRPSWPTVPGWAIGVRRWRRGRAAGRQRRCTAARRCWSGAVARRCRLATSPRWRRLAEVWQQLSLSCASSMFH